MVVKIQDSICINGQRRDDQNWSKRMESSRGHKHKTLETYLTQLTVNEFFLEFVE